MTALEAAPAEEAPVEPAASKYITVAQAIERAPLDLVEKDVDGVFGGMVRIRSLTASQASRVKKESIRLGGQGGQGPEFNWTASELLQFELGVIEPKFTADEVRTLHLTSGPSFAKVIAELDKISGIDKSGEGASRKAAAFPEGS